MNTLYIWLKYNSICATFEIIVVVSVGIVVVVVVVVEVVVVVVAAAVGVELVVDVTRKMYIIEITVTTQIVDVDEHPLVASCSLSQLFWHEITKQYSL